MSFHYFEAAAHATVYNKFRPSPPEGLVKRVVDYIAEKIPEPFHSAVDIGCGSGQSTEVLAPYFQQIIGFDPSDTQITEANKKNKLPNITYRTGSAESIECADSSVQLITASQSCHWFDLPKFYAEAERILVPGGVLAMYGYLLPQPRCGNVSQQLCDVVDKYYNITLGRYVLPESKQAYVENYKGDAFNKVPFATSPVLRDETTSVEKNGTVSDLVGYVSSWSAFQNYQKHEGEEKAKAILQQFQKEIMDALGVSSCPEETNIQICYKYFLLLAKKPLEN